MLGSSGHKKKRAREKETREGKGSSLTRRVSPSRAPVLSFAHYFQAPATQASSKQKTFSSMGEFSFQVCLSLFAGCFFLITQPLPQKEGSF